MSIPVENLSQLESECHKLLDQYGEGEEYNLSVFQNIVQAYRGRDWQDHIPSSPLKRDLNNYYRVRIDSRKQDRFEICLIRWNPQSESPIHNHSKYGCIFKVLQQGILEDRYAKVGHRQQLELLKTEPLSEGAIGYIHNQLGFHSIRNTNSRAAFTLHIYAPANHKTTYFDKTSN